MTYEVVVIGSANQDLALTVTTIPRPGETVLAVDRATHAGGKGLNQAVAAARAGASTAFVGAVGDDAPGAMLREVLAEAGIGTDRLKTSDQPTGVAVITIDERGENSIIVAGGANMTLALTEADLEPVRSAKVLVLQLEVPMATVREAAAAAQAAGVTVVLNAAPARWLDQAPLDRVDLLVVNEHEARTLVRDAPEATGVARFEAFAARLLEFVPAAVITMGGHGALATRRGGRPVHQRAPQARVVDTTGAGDTFTGALAAALARGESLDDAVWFATCAASLAVEVAGAVPSIPHLDAIKDRMRFHRCDRRSPAEPAG